MFRLIGTLIIGNDEAMPVSKDKEIKYKKDDTNDCGRWLVTSSSHDK